MPWTSNWRRSGVTVKARDLPASHPALFSRNFTCRFSKAERLEKRVSLARSLAFACEDWTENAAKCFALSFSLFIWWNNYASAALVEPIHVPKPRLVQLISRRTAIRSDLARQLRANYAETLSLSGSIDTWASRDPSDRLTDDHAETLNKLSLHHRQLDNANNSSRSAALKHWTIEHYGNKRLFCDGTLFAVIVN
jgi:hypothetical protein